MKHCVYGLILVILLINRNTQANSMHHECRRMCELGLVENSEILYFKCMPICKEMIKHAAHSADHHEPAVVTNHPPTTTDVCDLFCSLQVGGHACDCSKPGLPG